MNEQAWKEQAARIIDPASWAVMDSYLKQMLRKYKGQNIGYDPEAFKHKESMAIATALWPLVQQAIAAERGEPVAWMYKSVFGTEICRFRWGADEGLTSDHWVGWAETPLYTLRTQIFGEASDGE